jgi:hypothetical protein
MAKFILPEEKFTPYREMLMDLFFTKANDFDASGHYVCKLFCPQILILQRAEPECLLVDNVSSSRMLIQSCKTNTV